MLTSEQAEAASKALMQQQVPTSAQDDEEKVVRDRKRHQFLVLGMIGGGLLNWFLSGNAFPGLAIGMGVGAIIGALLDARIRRAYLVTLLSLTLAAVVAWYALRL